MKKIGVIQYIVILLGVSLLAACGQASQPNTNKSAPTVNAPVSAPTAAANSKSTEAKPAPIKVDACTLLPKDDVGKVLGQGVDEATGKGLGGVCSYKTKDLSIDLTLFHTGAVKYLQQTREKIGDSALVVQGLGDEAFYNVNSNVLIMRKGDAAYLITVVGINQELPTADKQAKEKALAVQLLTHLQ